MKEADLVDELEATAGRRVPLPLGEVVAEQAKRPATVRPSLTNCTVSIRASGNASRNAAGRSACVRPRSSLDTLDELSDCFRKRGADRRVGDLSVRVKGGFKSSWIGPDALVRQRSKRGPGERADKVDPPIRPGS